MTFAHASVGVAIAVGKDRDLCGTSLGRVVEKIHLPSGGPRRGDYQIVEIADRNELIDRADGRACMPTIRLACLCGGVLQGSHSMARFWQFVDRDAVNRRRGEGTRTTSGGSQELPHGHNSFKL